MKRSFFSVTAPRLQVDSLPGVFPDPVRIETPREIMLLIEETAEKEHAMMIQKGDPVKTGQKISLTPDSGAYAISTVTGTITHIEPFPGESGKQFTAVTVAVSKEADLDERFAAYCDTPSLKGAVDLLGCLPGSPTFEIFTDADKPIQTIVINAMDQDLFIITAQYALKAFYHELTQGIQHLKTITGVEHVVIAAPQDAIQGYGDIGASVISVGKGYPEGLPHLIAQRVIGHEIPVGKNFQDLGLAFLSVEAVASLGRSFQNKKTGADQTGHLSGQEWKSFAGIGHRGHPHSGYLQALSRERERSGSDYHRRPVKRLQHLHGCVSHKTRYRCRFPAG